ncbi:MAG: response regulator [Magnetococcales bacterium]|nr:response regulator [Magnetococcales bacterium]
MRVLIVDDSSVMRKIVQRSLRQAGLMADEVREAGNGMEGVNALKAGPVDLILCDWNMPVMDGLTFVKTVRSGPPQVKGIPIVMVTTEGGEDRMAAAKEAGASGHIKKPFTTTVMQETLGKYFK